jgi:hypothetical protein
MDDNFLARSKLGTIVGTIYFEIGEDQFFPEKGWTDLIIAFSRSWLEALLQIADGSVVKENIPFFDGPLAVSVSVNSPGVAQLDFIHRETVKVSTAGRIQDLLENALAVANFLLKICHEKGWADTDTEVLAGLMKRGFQILSQGSSKGPGTSGGRMAGP